MHKSNKAITLIALIITIIVLLILAGVTINMVLGDNGIVNKSKTSVAKYENAQEKENSVLAGYEADIDNARETVTISKEEYEILKNGNTYSTEEKRIGTWIDGKPLYRKTFLFNEKLSQSNDISIPLKNIENILIDNDNSFAKQSNVNVLVPINWVHGFAQTTVSVSGLVKIIDNNTVDLLTRVGSAFLTETQYLTLKQVTFQYTKTTDPAPTT